MPPSTLQFDLAEEEALLVSSVRQLLAGRNAQDAARRFWADDADFDRDLWAQLGELGFAGMAAPERSGGAASGMRQLGLVAEELGRACAAVPFELHSLAVRLIAGAENAGSLSAVLAAAARGTAVLTAALDVPAMPEAAEHQPLAERSGAVSGVLALVAEGAVAGAVVVPAETGLALVEGGFRREHVATLGMNRRANLEFEAAAATPLRLAAVAAMACLRCEGAFLFASRQVGMGDWLLRQTTDYAAARVQFGRPIGSFQAIQHKLSEMYTALTAGRHLVRYAASLLDGLASGANAELAVSRAKAFMATAMWRATVEAHQIHAGVGFILEHPLHLYFAASRGAESLFGDARLHQRKVGAALLVGDGFRANSLLGAA